MATLFLIRHALTAQTGRILYGQAPGIDLDDRGRTQAERLAERFASVRLTAIYSSPLDRCTQTVEPLATAKRLRVSLAPDLIEMDTGAWTGRTLPQVRRTKLWRVVQTEPSRFRFPGGEGFVEAETRALAAVDRIARKHPRGRVVVDTASVSVVVVDGGQRRVVLANDTGGLERFGEPAIAPWEAAADGGRRRRGK